MLFQILGLGQNVFETIDADEVRGVEMRPYGQVESNQGFQIAT
jgi:hypothetical protein